MEIMEFIDGLRQRNFLSSSQASLLNSLLSSNSTLLFAAYSVAISANDSEYLAEICKDLAQSLISEQGRSACEAQDEVLQVADQLYINNRISENQLLYLRHLVLIREEAVASIYDQYQEDQNVPHLAKALYELCNTHPYQHARQTQQSQQQQRLVQDSDSADEEEDDEVSCLDFILTIVTTATTIVALYKYDTVLSYLNTYLIYYIINNNNRMMMKKRKKMKSYLIKYATQEIPMLN